MRASWFVGLLIAPIASCNIIFGIEVLESGDAVAREAGADAASDGPDAGSTDDAPEERAVLSAD
jgi:hypothetical protein